MRVKLTQEKTPLREITGNLWDFDGKPGYLCCITTNGTLKKNGQVVMGKGCAKQAADKYPELPKILGEFQQGRNGTGNVVWKAHTSKREDNFLMIFPVKHNWYETADIELIRRSAEQLASHAKRNQHLTFILPRPGCGNGGLKWEDVKPVIESILPDNVCIISPK